MYKRLLWEVRLLWPILIISISGSIIYASCDAYSMHLLEPLFNKGFIIPDKGGNSTLKVIALKFLITFLIRGIGAFLSTYFMGKLGSNVVFYFRQQIFKKFLNLPAKYYDKTSSGKLLSKILYNVDQVTHATGSAIITLVQDGTFIIGLIIVMVTTSWQLSITVIILVPFLAIFIAWISKKFRRYSRNTQFAMGLLTHVAEESLINYKEIRIFGGQKNQQQKFDEKLKYTYSQQLKTLMLDALSSPIIQFIGAAVISLILFIVATIGREWLNAGEFLAFFSSMMAILKPIKNITKINSTIQKAIAATEDIFYILDYEEEKDSGIKNLIDIKKNINFKDISFNYEETKEETLKNINLKIKKGQTIAFVGRSGGGKTTLVNLLSRFYNPQRGEIYIDNINIQTIKLKNLRKKISLVSQHVNLFDDTIFNNIAYGKEKNIQKEKVIMAAIDANAWNFIKTLPKGIYTKMGQNGLNLSGGQRQRIAIARALLKNAPILILDEATSALDNESEKKVQQALNKLMSNKTTLVIAHRLSTIKNADKIVVMDKGCIIEKANHKELLNNKNSLYRKLYKKNNQ